MAQVYKFLFMYTEAQPVHIEECTKKKKQATLKGWKVAKLSVEKLGHICVRAVSAML